MTYSRQSLWCGRLTRRFFCVFSFRGQGAWVLTLVGMVALYVKLYYCDGSCILIIINYAVYVKFIHNSKLPTEYLTEYNPTSGVIKNFNPLSKICKRDDT